MEEKDKIVREALKLLRPEESIIIAPGSTCTAFSKVLDINMPLNVVTPSLGIAFLLNDNPNVEVFVLGGKVNKKSFSVRGDYAGNGLKNVSFSKLFTGCGGIDLETGITCATIEESQMPHVMMKTLTSSLQIQAFQKP